MKTQLPESVVTVEQAEALLTELNNNGEAFHPEDDAHDIDFVGVDVSNEEKDQLNKLMSDIYSLGGFDPCDFLMSLNPIEDDE